MKRGVQRSYRDVPSIQVGEEAVQRLEDGVEPSWDIVLWASIVTVDTWIADRPGWAGLYAVLYDRRDCRARGTYSDIPDQVWAIAPRHRTCIHSLKLTCP